MSRQSNSTGSAVDWGFAAKTILKQELTRHKITYKELSERLARHGIRETPRTIAQKMLRGRFQMTFFLQCMYALKLEKVTIQCVPIADETQLMEPDEAHAYRL